MCSSPVKGRNLLTAALLQQSRLQCWLKQCACPVLLVSSQGGTFLLLALPGDMVEKQAISSCQIYPS